MSKPTVSYPDIERSLIDGVITEMAEEGETVTVGIPVPTAWVKGTTTHVQVAVDGIDMADHPIVARATARFTIWDDQTTEAKRVANALMAILLANRVGSVACRPLTGTVATQDPDTRAQLATFSVLAVMRSDTSLIS